MSEEQKQNIQEEQFQKLVETLVDFAPSQIFVEYPYSMQDNLHNLFVTDEVSDSFKRNEIYRIAFQLARKLELSTVQAVDWNESVPGIPDIGAILEGPDGETLREILMKFERLNYFEKELLSRDLVDYFRHINHDAIIQQGHMPYVEMMAVNDDAFEWTARYWYYRNLKIVQLMKRTWLPDTERALLLIGAGHSYLVRQQLLEEPRYKVITYDEWMAQKSIQSKSL